MSNAPRSTGGFHALVPKQGQLLGGVVLCLLARQAHCFAGNFLRAEEVTVAH